MPIGPALTGAIRDTTLEASQAAGAHDAIVVGAGAAGGMAALLLAEAGLRVLVLDAGRSEAARLSPLLRATNAVVRKLADPATLRYIPPAAVPMARIALRGLGLFHQPVQSRCGVWGRAPERYVDDRESPYVTPPDKPFVWIRSRQLGGRMVLPGHGRQYYRLSPSDMTAPDGSSTRWPLEPAELDPWYSLVERRLKLAGGRDGIAWQPDSDVGRVLEATAHEAALMNCIRTRWPGARPMLGRFAPPLDSLEIAAGTGRLRCRQGAIAKRIDVGRSGKVAGVTWLDQQSGTEVSARAPLVFLCASTLESTRLLLLSRSAESPEGLGTASGVLGRNLMDHMIISGWGSGPPLPAGPKLEEERSIYLPRFDARSKTLPGPEAGFGVQIYQFAGSSSQSHFTAVTFGEMLPRHENRVTLHPTRRDAWGIPVPYIDCTYDEADLARAAGQMVAIRELTEAVGVSIGRINSRPTIPGVSIHECGTARMGRNAADSVLDPHNQCWEAKGLYVTDGASFASQGTQNPTLTILALTARACHHAVSAGG